MTKLKVEVSEFTSMREVQPGQVRSTDSGDIIVLVVLEDIERFNAVILRDKKGCGSDLTFELNHSDAVLASVIEENYPNILNAKMTIGDDVND